jgi:hypothetical protein
MANRAYLFSSNVEELKNINNEFPKEFYDSRWNIPLLWFLFFNMNSIKMQTFFIKDEPKETWETAILVEDKDIAIKRFEDIFSIFNPILNFSDSEKSDFIKTISKWQGSLLVLDPWEIIQSEGEKSNTKTLKDFSMALELLEIGAFQKAFNILDVYAGKLEEIIKKNNHNLTNYFIGFHYY